MQSPLRIWKGAAVAFGISVALVSAGASVQAHGLKAAPPTPISLTLPSTPPQGAIVLFSGKESELREMWIKRYSTEPAGWVVKDKIATPNKSDIVTKQEFGDAIIHVEFRCPKEGGGNAGVGIQGRYEVQIFNSFGQEPESHNAAALYSQKAARINASKPAGEWQSYDIFFRAPRFDDKGAVTEKPRVTVIQNGVIVQNNEEFTGMTGIQYGEFKEMTKTGPLILQGDHDVVQYRNVWVIPM
ncbi:MAG: DUF1080 domain-containing protein [bacterium]|jgi:hypothetical protein